MKNTKKLFAAALLLALATSAFAEMGMYFKGGLGISHRAVDVKTDGTGTMTTTVDYPGVQTTTTKVTVPTTEYKLDTVLFGITPAFGIEPFRDKENAFLRNLSFEFSFDLAFGVSNDRDDSVLTFTPGVMAVYSLQNKSNFLPRFGAGFSLPIQRVEPSDEDYEVGFTKTVVQYNDSLVVGFDINLMAGVAYKLSEKILPFLDMGLGFGSSFVFDVRTGVIYKIK